MATAFASPDSSSADRFTQLVTELPKVSYSPDSFRMKDYALTDPEFIWQLSEMFGGSVFTPASLVYFFKNQLSTADQKPAGLMYALCKSLISEVNSIGEAELNTDQLGAIRFNVLTVLFLILQEDIFPDLQKHDLDLMINSLLSRVMHKDPILTQWVIKFFGAFTRVGGVMRYLEVFESAGTPDMRETVEATTIDLGDET